MHGMRLLTVMLVAGGMAAAQSPVRTAVAYPDEGPLAVRVQTLLAEPDVAEAHWGIAVTAMDGSPIFGMDEGKLFRPASTAKLFTTAAAMALLGPESIVATKVFGKLDKATGVVDGDLVLRGGGDANFGADDVPYVPPGQRNHEAAKKPALQDLEELTDQLVAKGVKRVTGNIVGDDTQYPYEPYPEGWEAEDLVWGYGAPVSALSIHDNELKMTVTPGMLEHEDGTTSLSAPAVAFFPGLVSYYKVQNGLDTEADESAKGVGAEFLPGTRTLHLYGSMAQKGSADVEHIAILDPANYAAMALRELLVERGIEVQGQAIAAHQFAQNALSFAARVRAPDPSDADELKGKPVVIDCLLPPPKQNLLVEHISPTLGDDVVATLKESLNLHAETMLHNLGDFEPCQNGSAMDGARVVRAYWMLHGLSGDDFLLFDGSGLSTHDLVAPRAEVELLAFAATQPWFAQWKAALPVGGVDGTLEHRFTEAPLKGKVFAKTGTLGESRALAGYVVCASGRQVIFSVMVDDHAPGSSADRKVMDEIVAAIAAAE